MLNIFKKIFVCKFAGHKLEDAGSCPYTGKTYQYCSRCLSLVVKA